MRGAGPAVALLAALFACATTAANAVHAQSPAPTASHHFERVGSFGGAVTGIVVDGTRAYVSSGERVDAYDVTDPGVPRPLGESAGLGGVVTVRAAAGGLLFATVRSGLSDAIEDRLVVMDTRGARPVAVGDLGVAVRGEPWVKAVEALATDGRAAFIAPGVADEDEAPRSRTLQLRDLRTFPAVRAATFEMSAPVFDLAQDGHWLFALTEAGITVLDVSEPLAPVVAARMPLPWPQAIALRGTTAVVLASGGLHRIDISDPRAPVERVPAVPVSGDAIAIAGRDAWVMQHLNNRYRESVVTHVDLDNPDALLVSAAAPDLRGAVAIGDRLLVAQGRSGLRSLALSGGHDPYVDDRWHADALGAVAGIAAANGLAYLADADLELWVLDPSNAAAPRIVSRIEAPSDGLTAANMELAGIAVRGSAAYLGYYGGPDEVVPGGGVATVDIGDPQAPTVSDVWEVYKMPADEEQAVTSYGGPINMYGPTLRGDTLYLTGGTVPLTALDVSDPMAPRWRGRFGGNDPYFEAGGLALDGATGWLALPFLGVGVIDLTLPEHPGLIGRVALPGIVRDVARSGNAVLAAVGSRDDVSANDSLIVIDPATQRPVGSLAAVPAGRLSVDGARAFLTNHNALAAVDVSDPAAPRLEASIALAGTHSGDLPVVHRQGDLLWVADGDLGLSILRLVEGDGTPTGRAATVYLPALLRR